FVQSRLHDRVGNAEDLRDLVSVEVFAVAKPERLALIVGERRERERERLLVLLSREPRERAPERGRERRIGREPLPVAPPSPRPEDIQAVVPRDVPEPGREIGDRLARGERLREDVLRGVLRLVAAPEVAFAEPDQR